MDKSSARKSPRDGWETLAGWLIPYWFISHADTLNHRYRLNWNWPCWLLDWYHGALPEQNRD